MADIHDLYSGILSNVHMELPHKTMDKKLIVNVAPTGSFMNWQQNPGQPYTMEENVKAAIEAYKAGAAVWHVHARDKDGTPSKDPYVLKETIARVLEKCPDIVTSVVPYADYDHQGVDLLKRTVDVLTHAGPEFFQSAVLLIQTTGFSEKFTYIITEKTLSEQVKYLEDHGVRPEYQATSYQGIKDVLDWLVSKGIAKDPPLMNIMMGFHGFCHGSPLGPDPWNYIYMMTMQQTLAPNAVKGVCAGGRNWTAVLHVGDNSWIRHGAGRNGGYGLPLSSPRRKDSDLRPGCPQSHRSRQRTGARDRHPGGGKSDHGHRSAEIGCRKTNRRHSFVIQTAMAHVTKVPTARQNGG